MTTASPRQRVLTALGHHQTDRVPYQISCTVPARRKLQEYYGTTELDDLLGNHLAKYKARPPDELGWIADRPGFWLDEWGVTWNRTVDRDIGVVETYLLRERSLKGLTVPDPMAHVRFAALPAFIERNRDRFRYVSFGMSLFERAWSLRGMADLLVDMIEAPEWVDELLDMILAFDLAVVDEMLKYDIDGLLYGDDWGQQRGLIFGPRLWRRFIKPRVAQLYAAVKRSGKTVMIHCCGKVQELFPDLIEVGLDVFNPFQPDVMNPYEMKRLYGDRLAFFGGVSVQHLLPHGTPAEIRDEVRRLMEQVGRDGGFIIAASHDMPGDIPLENMIAFIETARA
jgi:uroporphyrinogen decarboxylase